jgi:hypothetical protein
MTQDEFDRELRKADNEIRQALARNVELRAARDDLADALRALLDAHKDEAHSMPGEAWGYDAAGIHGWEPGEPQECPICEALDAARAALDRHTHQEPS